MCWFRSAGLTLFHGTETAAVAAVERTGWPPLLSCGVPVRFLLGAEGGGPFSLPRRWLRNSCSSGRASSGGALLQMFPHLAIVQRQGGSGRKGAEENCRPSPTVLISAVLQGFLRCGGEGAGGPAPAFFAFVFCSPSLSLSEGSVVFLPRWNNNPRKKRRCKLFVLSVCVCCKGSQWYFGSLGFYIKVCWAERCGGGGRQRLGSIRLVYMYLSMVESTNIFDKTHIIYQKSGD
ncbi:uncharacterized protein KNAG_0C04510 [Huiozyma naganishii CBS 8797]|uniref:Uncharacterized protein n=1 Tax=Huiozyma naganishii (strain ATCC MYA-139 / BCRC 22969 / CBS 8797 / KCTC 17520 / NBRC 10181 / NCYC 3082 / Yp74L-3) TaxID=1071383 RepID=J7RJ61_HUIN7|nr:hypothetical protein KNAG_0C04510 [Kazachstania naganishii CBS 8797]CCK69553.1 hypothetical protein KNAG_0C04510 [Kazachstania naganishii CBS 8797]